MKHVRRLARVLGKTVAQLQWEGQHGYVTKIMRTLTPERVEWEP